MLCFVPNLTKVVIVVSDQVSILEDRLYSVFSLFVELGTVNHICSPFFGNVTLSQFHPCKLHAIFPFGKNMLIFSCNHILYQIVKQEATFIATDNFLK